MKTGLCPVCGKGHLMAQVGDFQADLPSEGGIPRQLVVPDISWLHCTSCNEDILDEAAEQTISAAQRAALGLLSADQLRQLRKSIGKSQAAMSELLGIGEKTYCRWESGSHFQTEAFDRYLRLLIEEPFNLVALQEIAIRKREGAERRARVLETFSYLQDFPGVEEWEQRFLAAMESGTLQCPQTGVN